MGLNRDRKFELVLYPDSTSYNCVEVLASCLDYFDECAYILHDKDVLPNGEIKKPHYHVYGRWSSSADPRMPNAVAYDLCVPVTSLSNVHKWKSAIRYLIHADNPEKYQYSIEDIVSSFSLISLFKPTDDSEMAKMIFDYICSCRDPPSFSILLQWCLDNGCYSSFRRGFAVWSSLLREMSLNG